jgi:hypothetical protein
VPVHLPPGFSIEVPDGHRFFLDSALEGSQFINTHQPGIYRIFNDTNQLVAGFAVHAGSPRESNLSERLSSEEIEAVTVKPVPLPSSEVDFEEYWPWHCY